MIGLFDPTFWILVGPAILLGLLAQIWVRSAYASARRLPAPLSGAAAARHILDSAGLESVEIQQVPGYLSDHYDSRQKVLRLSPEVYQSRSLAAVGIAAHEAGHAIQDARAYVPLAIRNAAVPAASFGSGAGIWMLILGLIFQLHFLLWAGIALFVCFVFFQVVNLPVEFNASTRAKTQLAQLGIVDSEGMVYVDRVLKAAALTYLAATLQAILTLLYYLMLARGRD
jgi:Zn-dependent membrane protease YugP